MTPTNETSPLIVALPLTFPVQKMLATFEFSGRLAFDTTAVHINAAFDFAVNNQ